MEGGKSMVENYTLLWLVVGGALCLMELFIPTAFVEMSMGVAALFVALVSPLVPQLTVQLFLWLVFSVFLVWAVKRWLPKQKPYSIADATEATTLTEISPERIGRVLYEGNSWAACCEGDWTIPTDCRVVVVGRRGNTLIVMPEDLSRS